MSGLDPREARELGYLGSGEAAGLLGISPRTVHFYEEIGLIAPRRSVRGTRFFRESDLRRLEVCVRLACLGVPLQTVRDLAGARGRAAAGAEYARRVSELVGELRGRFRTDIAVLREMLAALEEVQDELGRDDPPGAPDLADRGRMTRALLELVASGTDRDEAPVDDPPPPGRTPERAGRERRRPGRDRAPR